LQFRQRADVERVELLHERAERDKQQYQAKGTTANVPASDARKTITNGYATRAPLPSLALGHSRGVFPWQRHGVRRNWLTGEFVSGIAQRAQVRRGATAAN
jgi:hypothetical protein